MAGHAKRIAKGRDRLAPIFWEMGRERNVLEVSQGVRLLTGIVEITIPQARSFPTSSSSPMAQATTTA